MKSQCAQKATCDVCKGSHPTLLHRSTATDNNAGQSPGSSSESSHFAPFLVVPYSQTLQSLWLRVQSFKNTSREQTRCQ